MVTLARFNFTTLSVPAVTHFKYHLRRKQISSNNGRSIKSYFWGWNSNFEEAEILWLTAWLSGKISWQLHDIALPKKSQLWQYFLVVILGGHPCHGMIVKMIIFWLWSSSWEWCVIMVRMKYCELSWFDNTLHDYHDDDRNPGFKTDLLYSCSCDNEV